MMMLVWDRNSNDRVDFGQEMFGDETILSNGQNGCYRFCGAE